MKKIILILGLVLMAYTAQSQIIITLLLGDKLNSDGLEFGLVGGANYSKISGLDTQTPALKWNLGFYFDIRVKNQWYLYTGVLVKSNTGVHSLSDRDMNSLGASIYPDTAGVQLVGDYNQVLSTFLVPIMINYHFKNHLSVKFGGQLGLVYKSWVQFEYDIEGRDGIIKEYNTDITNRIDVGLSAGMAYRMMQGKGWTIGAYYYYGLTDVFKDIPNTKNSSIFVELCIPIGAGEKKIEKE